MREHTQGRASDPMIGQTIYEFQIEKKLAEGGMGMVYLARHRLMTSTIKVIKVLLPEYAKNAILRQRFHREAEAASKLKHENILGIDNFGTLDDGQLFIMVPYLEGQPLDGYLHSRGGRLSSHRALHLVVQLCDALAYAHALGIIHRDLKPGNVFLVPTSSNPYMLKLLDFGIAKMVGAPEGGPKTQSGAAIGTPGYMAIEQYEHADEVTHLADVYSLAVMIWEIVTGRLPWQHPDHAVLYYLQRTSIPDRPPADVMPAEWADILLAAMSVDPGTRPQSARELAMALASSLPVVGRLPSGAEILAGLAPHFVRQGTPEDETVRNAAQVDRIGPLLWPPRETAPAAPRELAHQNVEPSGHSGDDATRAPTVSVEVNEHVRAAQHAVLPTTLSAATGVTSVVGERHRGRWKLALVAACTAAVAALATGTIATRAASGTAAAPEAIPSDRADGRSGSAGSGSVEARASSPVPDAVPDAALDAVMTPAPIPPATPELRDPAPVRAAVNAEASERAPELPPIDAAKVAPPVRPPTRPAVENGPKAIPAESARSLSEPPRRPKVFDPNDVSGPEE